MNTDVPSLCLFICNIDIIEHGYYTKIRLKVGKQISLSFFKVVYVLAHTCRWSLGSFVKANTAPQG